MGLVEQPVEILWLERFPYIRRKLVRVAILDFPGLVLIGLAIYGKDSEGR